jgi:putative transposase
MEDHYEVKDYAFCLMTTHVNLLLEPPGAAGALAQLMQRLAVRQTRWYVHRLEGRSGTLWESRYKSSPVETNTYLVACARSIELNPVRAGMVARPGDYPWSSYPSKTGGPPIPWLDLDPCDQGLGREAQERARRYQAFVDAAIPPDEWARMRQVLQRGQLTGTDRFVEDIAATIGTRITRRGQGRPKKELDTKT